MKTEKQAVEKLDLIVEEFNQVASKVTGQEPEPDEATGKLLMLFGFLLCLSWVLDCEKELKPLLRALKIEAIAQEFEGKLST